MIFCADIWSTEDWIGLDCIGLGWIVLDWIGPINAKENPEDEITRHGSSAADDLRAHFCFAKR